MDLPKEFETKNPHMPLRKNLNPSYAVVKWLLGPRLMVYKGTSFLDGYKEIGYDLCWFICFSFFEQQKIELYVMDSGKSIRLSEFNNILI